MRVYRRAVFPVAAMMLAACADESGTASGPDAEELSADLTLVVPTDVRTGSIVRDVFENAAFEGGPARSEHLGYGTYPEYEPEPVPEESGIWNAQTRANFLPGQLSVVGSHDYVGNKGSIETKGYLQNQGSVIGTHHSYREQSYPILWPPWDVHFIWAEARIYTDRECGLDGWGDSLHKAWWEAVFGGPVSSFSSSHASSIADRTFQPTCPSDPPPAATNTGFTSTGGGGEMTCYIWIEYDIYTGEIYDQQLLYCTDGG